MTPQEAAAIASVIRRQMGEDAENYIRKNIIYFETPPANIAAATAWLEVRQALKRLDDLGEPPKL